jgi:hypothetical protein|tara:strand:- start:91 stop:225 length:135 start_codon:yes stop_codon:yes gene_type:complete
MLIVGRPLYATFAFVKSSRCVKTAADLLIYGVYEIESFWTGHVR